MIELTASYRQGKTFDNIELKVSDILIHHSIFVYEEAPHECICIIHMDDNNKLRFYIEYNKKEKTIIYATRHREEFNVEINKENLDKSIVDLAHFLLGEKCQYCVCP